ncbi:MAG: hypothetical protein ACK4VO_07955 [Pseudobdellovibrio sp.]
MKITTKMTIVSTALLVASLASAQTTTEQAAQQTATQTQVVAKKAKKVKKTKKVEEKTTQTTPATSVAPATAPAAAATTSQVDRAVAAVKDAAMAPAQTSTATVATTAAPAKKWRVSVTNLSEFSSQVEGESAARDFGNATVKNTVYLGASYKITSKSSVGFRQYFNHTHNPGKDSSFNEIKQDWSTLTYATSTKGILGSEDIAPLFRYYLPNDVVERNSFEKDLENFYGIVRADAVIAWVLNPKWTVSYVLSPRQSFGAKQNTTLKPIKDEKGNQVVNELGQKMFKQYYFAPSTKLVHMGALYYNVNDNIQPYATAGMTHSVETNELKSQADYADFAVGANFVYFGGKLLINPEISNSVELKKDGATAAAPRWMQSEDISYSLTTAISL